WRRYFESLVRLAQRRLSQVPRCGASEDEEDAAISAFHSLCTGAAGGRFDFLNDPNDLFRLLVVITARKALGQIQLQRRQERGGGKVLGEAAMPWNEEGDGAGLDALVGPEPTPEFATLIAEEVRSRLDALGDESLRRIALW